MFANLPEEIEHIIWKFYFTNNVVKKINQLKSVWTSPSDHLLTLCNEIGTIQHKYTDLERIIFANKNENTDMVNDFCFKELCMNCLYHKFPCMNAWYYGGFNAKLCGVWSMDFYKE
jgi:hypothetical protein